MEFKKYQHLERFGTSEVENIELGKCYVFPKIDGSNGSIWQDKNHQICAGSRERELGPNDDNQGFYGWVICQENIRRFFADYPHLRLYGEWLVPHTVRTYRQDTWRKFYVFDVMRDDSYGWLDNPMYSIMAYDDYAPLLKNYGIECIPPIRIVENGNLQYFQSLLEENTYLIEDGKGTGEGIVIKNYDFKNRFGRTVWAKIVRNEFKEKLHKPQNQVSIARLGPVVEEAIATKYTTKALVDKEYAKIDVEVGFTSKQIHRLLMTVFYSVVKEDCWEFVKEHKNPQIDFKRLQHFVFKQVRELKPEIF